MDNLRRFWFQITSSRESAGLVIAFLTLFTVFLPHFLFIFVIFKLAYFFGLELEKILQRKFLRIVPIVGLVGSLISPFAGVLFIFLTALGFGYFNVRLRGYYSADIFNRFVEDIFAGIYISFSLDALIRIKEYSTPLLLSLVLSIWAADTAAYYVGKKFGKTPFARLLSPSKTFEGFLGGLIAGTLVGTVSSTYFGLEFNSPLLWTTVVLISVLGDLFESFIKRSFGVKDSSNLLGSHGGLLDRFDALLFAALALASFLKF